MQFPFSTSPNRAPARGANGRGFELCWTPRSAGEGVRGPGLGSGRPRSPVDGGGGRRGAAWLLPWLLVVGVGCGGGNPEPEPEPAVDGGVVAPDLVFVPAPHPPLPELTPHSGVVLEHPRLVTITFPGYRYRSQVEAFGDFIVKSAWLEAVGKEYGVGPGSHLKKVVLPQAAPPRLAESDLITLLQDQIRAGAVPAPSPQNADLVLMVYLPASTTIDSDGLSCEEFFGYHYSFPYNRMTVPFGVVADCGMGLEEVTNTASHEIIEAATDSVNSWFLEVGDADHWVGLDGIENADLCEDHPPVREGPWVLQRSWSNVAARAGRPPCVPTPMGALYRGLAPIPAAPVRVKIGQSATFMVTGWSSAPAADWELTARVADYADFDPRPQLGARMINNGRTVAVTLSVPKSARRGQVGSTKLFADGGGDFWPLAVIAD